MSKKKRKRECQKEAESSSTRQPTIGSDELGHGGRLRFCFGLHTHSVAVGLAASDYTGGERYGFGLHRDAN